MATLTIADLDNGKRDLQTVDEVANSSADTTTTRYGDRVLTLAGALRRLGYQAPVPYASGLNVDSPLFTVSHEGVIYAPDPALVPFTTGAWGPGQWRVVQNTGRSNLVYQFPSLGDAQAAAAALPEGANIIVEGETHGHIVAGAYQVSAGVPADRLPAYADLDTYRGKATAIDIDAPGISGRFYRRGTAPSNGGTVRKDALNRSWERFFEGPIFSSWFEIKDGQECSAQLTAFFAAAFDGRKDWVLGYGEFHAATMGVAQIKTSGVSFGKINAPKSNSNFRLEIVRDAPGQVISTSAWNAALSRGQCDIAATNASGKNLFLLSTEVLMERIGSGGQPYRKQEFVRVGNNGSLTTALTRTYNSKANLTATAYSPSDPTDISLNIVRSGAVTGPTDRGSIMVSRDNVKLRPSVISDLSTQPMPVAIEVSYCADVTIEKPVISGFQYEGLGYGILAGTTIGLTVNDADIRDCRHAFTAAFDVDTVLNGGVFSHSVDSHWADRFVANDVKVYAPLGGAPFSFAGSDVTLNHPRVFGGRSLCVIRNDTPSLGGKVEINSPSVVSPGYYAQYYIFGYSSMLGPGSGLPSFTNAPQLPDNLIISNASISANTDLIIGAYIPAMEAPHIGLGACTFSGALDVNVITIGIYYNKKSSVQSRATRLVFDAVCDLRLGNALNLSTQDVDAARGAICFVGPGVRNADLRFSPNAAASIKASNCRLNNIELESPIAYSSQQYLFNGVEMSGGFVRPTLKNAAFMGASFSGSYSQFPAAANVTLVGCVRNSPQGALPADIRANVSAPFA